MAELKNTYITGSLSAKRIYENGKNLENKYGAQLSISSNKISLVSADNTELSTVTLPAGSATTPTNSTALSSSSTSLSGTTITVQASVTPTVSTGWVTAGTAGTVKIKRHCTNRNKDCNAICVKSNNYSN